MARVPEKRIQHSRELKLCKKVAELDETISLLMNAMDLLLDQIQLCGHGKCRNLVGIVNRFAFKVRQCPRHLVNRFLYIVLAPANWRVFGRIA